MVAKRLVELDARIRRGNDLLGLFALIVVERRNGGGKALTAW